MKHDFITIGFVESESFSIIHSLYDGVGDLTGIIILERARPEETMTLDEIILQHVQIELLTARGHLEHLLICKPEKRVWPKDHLAYKEHRKVSRIKKRIRRYLVRPF